MPRVGVHVSVGGHTVHGGAKSQTIARRLLMKGTKTDDPCKFEVQTLQIFSLFRGKEKAQVGQVSVFIFRELARSCPQVLGEYDSRADKLVFKVPAVPSDEWRAALCNFANISESNLRAALSHEDMRGGRRRQSRRAGMAASQP